VGVDADELERRKSTVHDANVKDITRRSKKIFSTLSYENKKLSMSLLGKVLYAENCGRGPQLKKRENLKMGEDCTLTGAV